LFPLLFFFVFEKVNHSFVDVCIGFNFQHHSVEKQGQNKLFKDMQQASLNGFHGGFHDINLADIAKKKGYGILWDVRRISLP
jgi:hypothetical protein